jgi:iron complex outermembrane receptor protein
MKRKLLSRSVRAIVYKSALVGFGAAAMIAAHADDSTAPPEKVERIEVTGSSIKSSAIHNISPITIIKSEDLQKRGITTVAEALASISANQTQFTASSNVGAASTVGASADLRGIGQSETLVLLNGRRLPNSPFEGATVDLAIIPLAALDRIEILRDGASAIYGTDAIGGVINFITKKSYQGVTTSVEGGLPGSSGGGSETHFNVTGGVGDLGTDGWNMLGVLDFHQQQPLYAKDRSFTRQGGLRPDLGLTADSSYAYPANFYELKDDIAGNPANPACSAANTHADGTNCRYNYPATLGIVPRTKEFSFLGKGTFKINDHAEMLLEYLHTQSNVTTLVAPDPFPVTMPSTSKYYPGNGITPAYPGLTGGDLDVNLRTVFAGGRQDESINQANRFLLGFDGTSWGWDWKGGWTVAQSTALNRIVGGYLSDAKVQAAITNGTLNPFGPQAAMDAGVYSTLNVFGTYLTAQTVSNSLDFTASRDLFALPAGNVAVAVGTQFRHESSTYNVQHDVADQATSVGVSDAKSMSGKRDITALFTEFKIPLLESLELQLALRADHYSDFGTSTNPKFAFKWQPAKEIMFRSSYSYGFHAPSIYDLVQPANKSFTASAYDDPVLCPGGNVAPGGNPSRDCGQQFFKLLGGNANLKPEKSRTFNFGTVIEPTTGLNISIDYWSVVLTNLISTTSETAIFADPVKYAADYVRNPDGSINYVLDGNVNLGTLKTSGIDLGINYKLPETDFGKFGVSLDGTHVNSYVYQTEVNGPYYSNVGKYAQGVPNDSGAGGVVFRWRHTLDLNWSKGDWAADLSQTYSSGYIDQNTSVDPGFENHKVPSYLVYGLSGTFTGVKNLSLTLGIKNLFNRLPPATNTTDNFQIGYDPRYTDPLDRVYFVRATYKFL